jgi:hypothetical protein
MVQSHKRMKCRMYFQVRGCVLTVSHVTSIAKNRTYVELPERLNRLALKLMHERPIVKLHADLSHLLSRSADSIPHALSNVMTTTASVSIGRGKLSLSSRRRCRFLDAVSR